MKLISDLPGSSRYPDQLKPLEGLFGFHSEVEYYKGVSFEHPDPHNFS